MLAPSAARVSAVIRVTTRFLLVCGAASRVRLEQIVDCAAFPAKIFEEVPHLHHAIHVVPALSSQWRQTAVG